MTEFHLYLYSRFPTSPHGFFFGSKDYKYFFSWFDCNVTTDVCFSKGLMAVPLLCRHSRGKDDRLETSTTYLMISRSLFQPPGHQ